MFKTKLQDTIKISLFVTVFLICLALSFDVVNAQEFNRGTLERIKSEFLRSIPTPTSSSSRQKETTKEQPLSDIMEETTASPKKSVSFPTSQEILAKSDVSHIDPETYTLGPGDQLSVVFYGRLSQVHLVSVQPDGTIFISPANPIHVADMTLSQAQRKVHRVMSKYYKNFETQLQIIGLRTFRVEVLGEVENPGTYVITPTLGVCDVIGLAGGLNKNASLRNVVVKDKKTKKEKRIDLFAWFYLGDEEQNVLLNNNQTIFVPLMKDKITVTGAFKRTGHLEIVPGERVSDIISMIEPDTGAVLEEANLTRISEDQDLKVIPVNISEVIENPDSKENVPLADGDVLFVPALSVFLKKIKVIGELQGANLFTKQINRLTGQEEIIKLGLYQLREGETVKDVVVALGGTTVKADLDEARVERPVGDGRIKVIPVNLRKLLYEDDESQNVKLKPGDTFVVPAEPTNIYILGEIRSPGAYQYNVGNKIKEYVALAGGPTRRAKLKHTRVIQHIGEKLVVKTIDLRSILSGNLREEFELRPGDVIYIPYAEIISYRDIVDIITDIIVLQQLFE